LNKFSGEIKAYWSFALLQKQREIKCCEKAKDKTPNAF